MPAGSRRELAEAVRLGQQFLTLSREDDKVAPQIIANMDLGIVLVSRGEPKAAKQHFHEAISLYDPAEHDPLTLSYSYDPMVICAGYLAWILLALGYPDQAIERSTCSITTASSHRHPLSLGFAIARAAALHQMRRDVDKVGTLAADLHTLAAEQGVGTYTVVAAFYRGWMLAQRGHQRPTHGQEGGSAEPARAVGDRAGAPVAHRERRAVGGRQGAAGRGENRHDPGMLMATP